MDDLCHVLWSTNSERQEVPPRSTSSGSIPEENLLEKLSVVSTIPRQRSSIRSTHTHTPFLFFSQKEKKKGTLDDYSFLIHGLLQLFFTDFDEQWFLWARTLQSVQDELFWYLHFDPHALQTFLPTS
jgi:hypothetical protein